MATNGVGAIVDWLVNVNITVADFQIEAAIRISAYPGFILNRGTLAAEIRKRNQVTSFAFLAFGEIVGCFQRSHLPTCIV
jgi:hypothetical protein